MSAAAQVQSKVNPIADSLGNGLAAHPRGHSDDAVDAKHQDHNNQGNFVREILLHRPVSLVQKTKILSKKIKSPKARPASLPKRSRSWPLPA